jgi:anthranilate synthase component 1
VFVLYYPSLEEVLSLKENHSFIPISYKVWSDNLTPIRLFQQIKEKYSFLLESVEGGEKWARYSFIGNNPFMLFSVRQGQAYIQTFDKSELQDGTKSEKEAQEQKVDGDPIQLLKGLLKEYQIPKGLKLPRFTGGAVGYIGYDAISLVEDIPEHKEDLLHQDQVRLMFCDEIIAFDHLQQEITFISHLRVQPDQTDEEVRGAYDLKCKEISARISDTFEKVQRDHFQLFHIPEGKPEAEWTGVTSNFKKEEFIEAVKRVQEYIRAGDVFQTVLSQRFSVDIKTEPFNLYRVLRTVNPSPYLYYLDLGDDYQLIGSSPERMVQLDEGKVETNPIAGTRPRGKTAEEDEALAAELLADEKERAEHHMLLDLGRNDIGRIAEFGSVKVTKQMEIEKFSHVMHIVSTVEGRIQPHSDAIDCLFSCFPAGTVSGAPKIRAMQIIAELEKEARHAYSGSIGYFSFSGNLDSCITIRTMVVHQGKAYIQAGAGIVADSVPESEWQETRNKARAMLVAIQLAEKIFSQSDKEESIHA